MTLSVAVFIWVQPRPSRLPNFGWVMRCATSSSPWGCVGGCSWGPRGQLWCCCRGCGQSPHVGGNRLWPLVWLILHTRQSVAPSPRLSMVVGCIVIGPCFYDIFPSSFYYWVRMSSYLRQIPFLTSLEVPCVWIRSTSFSGFSTRRHQFCPFRAFRASP